MDTASPRRRLLRRPAVIDRVGLETSQIYELIREGRFPEPVPLGKRAVAWVESEIDTWIDERIRERKNQPRVKTNRFPKSQPEVAAA